MNIDGAGALVAGGASGLGEATVRRLVAGGANVVVADLNTERGEALASELGVTFVATDVTDEAQVQAAVDAAAALDGGLRLAVSCAGVGSGIKVASGRGPHPLAEFTKVIDINLIGTFNVIRLAGFAMLSNEPGESGERGAMVMTASVAAFDGQIGQLAYSASKGAVVSMTLTAARDLSDKGIRVCTIAPGIMDTPLLATLPEDVRESLGRQVPFPSRLGRPEEYAQLVQQIAENQMLNGETIRLDGAIRMAPR